MEYVMTREYIREQRDRLAKMLPEILERLGEIADGKYQATDAEVAAIELILSKTMPTLTDPHNSLLQKITGDDEGDG